MIIVYPVTTENMIPRGGGHVLASIFIPVDIGFVPEHTSAPFANIRDSEKRTDIKPNPVIYVGVPADGLFFEWFPPHENIVRIFAFEDQFKSLLEVFRRSKLFRLVNPGCLIPFMPVGPVRPR